MSLRVHVYPAYYGKVFDSGIVGGTIHTNNAKSQHTCSRLHGREQSNRRHAHSRKKHQPDLDFKTETLNKFSRLRDLPSDLANKKWDLSSINYFTKEQFKNFPGSQFFSKEQLQNLPGAQYLLKIKHQEPVVKIDASYKVDQQKPVENIDPIKVEQQSLEEHVVEANEGFRSFNGNNIKNKQPYNISSDKSDQDHLNVVEERLHSPIDTTVQTEKDYNISHEPVPGNPNESQNGNIGVDKKDEDGILNKLYHLKERFAPSEEETPSKPLMRHDFLERTSLDKRTVDLLNNIRVVAGAKDELSKLTRLRQFCEHLRNYPDCRGVAVKNKARPCLLMLSKSDDVMVKGQAYEALALIGHVDPPKGRGIRMLAIDGGGTRGLIAIEILRMLEKEAQKPIQQMFDFVIGTSTGSLVAALTFLFRLPLAQCEEIYKDRSTKMFTQHWLKGSQSVLSSQAYHDSERFEEILKTEMGDKYMIDFARDPTVPKMCVTSTLVNVLKWKNFMFRNYNLPPGVYADYPGNSKQKVWEVIRASTAAPMFYKEFQLGDYVFRDGGLLVNNPTALGIHECKLLWPNEELQCVISVGTGRYEPSLETIPKIRMVEKIKDLAKSIADSATDTEGVHATVRDMLPAGSYFRFNPYLSEESQLSEIRPEKMEQLQKDAQRYLHRNSRMLKTAVNSLKQERSAFQQVIDHGQRTFDENYPNNRYRFN